MTQALKVFVTVGSGSFDELIEQVDKTLLAPDYQVCCQIGRGRFKPHQQHFAFCDDYPRYMREADVVITHAGAGTVFELLEQGKRLLVVPNQFRVDKHQQDLAQFIADHRYAKVCWQLEHLADTLVATMSERFARYQKEPFFMAADLRQYLGLDHG